MRNKMYIYSLIIYIFILFQCNAQNTKPVFLNYKLATTELYVGNRIQLYGDPGEDEIVDYSLIGNYSIYFAKTTKFDSDVIIETSLTVPEIISSNVPTYIEYLNNSVSTGVVSINTITSSSLSCSTGKTVLSGTCSWIPDTISLVAIVSQTGLYTNQFTCSYLILSSSLLSAGSVHIDIICANM